MNLFRFHLTAAAAAVLVFGAAGCAESSDAGAQSSATESPLLPTDAPSTEPSGPEAPRSTDDTGGAITIPQLPVGGGAEDSRAEDQCVNVSWLQPELVPDNGVEVTRLQLEPSGVFDLGGPCGESPGCASFTFGSGADTCSVAVKALGTGGSARLTVRGKVTCAAGKEDSCQDLRTRVNPGSIRLTQPESPETGTTPSATG
jgi:hypothetical protein